MSKQSINERGRGGFSLLEVLLSVVIIAMIGGMSIPVMYSFQTRNDLDGAVNATVLSLRRAEILSQANDQDSSWGIALQPGTLTLLKGTSYATRDQTADEIFTVPASIRSLGLQEVIFTKMTGLPLTTGTITFTTSTNDTKTVTINAKGTINY